MVSTLFFLDTCFAYILTGKPEPIWFTNYCRVQQGEPPVVEAPAKEKKAKKKKNHPRIMAVPHPINRDDKGKGRASAIPTPEPEPAPETINTELPLPSEKAVDSSKAQTGVERQKDVEMGRADLELVVQKVGEMSVAKTATAVPPVVSPMGAPLQPAAASLKGTSIVPLEKEKEVISKGDKKEKVSTCFIFILFFMH